MQRIRHLFQVQKLMSCRNLIKPELKAIEGFDYILSVDVARSDNSKNNQTVISPLKIIRYKNGKIKRSTVGKFICFLKVF